MEEAISSDKNPLGFNEFTILTFVKNVTPIREFVEAERSGVNQQAIAEFCELNKSTVVYAIDRLEKMKLVKREADSKDRRVNFIFLTNLGFSRAEELLKKVHSMEDEMFSSLSGKEQEELRRLILKPVSFAEFSQIADP